MTDPLLKNHADMMLAVEAGYDYAPNIAQDMADRIKELEAEAEGAAAIIATERAEVLRLRERIEELEAKLRKCVGALGDISNGEPEWPDDPQKELDWCRNRATDALTELEDDDT